MLWPKHRPIHVPSASIVIQVESNSLYKLSIIELLRSIDIHHAHSYYHSHRAVTKHV